MSDPSAPRPAEPPEEGGDPACWMHLFDPFGDTGGDHGDHGDQAGAEAGDDGR